MCTTCNQNNCNGCGQELQICNQCPQQECDCPVKDLSTDCVLYTDDDIVCNATTVVAKNTILSNALQNIVSWSCTRFTAIENFFRIINTGTGSEIFSGINLLGEKKLRKINSTSPIITITQNTNDISVSVDEEVLDSFIETNQKTYSTANIGTGANLYKDSTVVGNNTQFNFRKVAKEDLGIGKSIIESITEDTNDIKVKVKTIVSDTTIITSTEEEIRIEVPTSSDIPSLYVNNNYSPSYEEWLIENTIQNEGTPQTGFIFRGKGTASQPFTDSTVYPLAGGSSTITINTAIQNALDGDSASTNSVKYSYVGSGTNVVPQRTGQKIIVLDNQGFYVFTGNLNYNNINIIFQANVTATTSNYLIDLDTASFPSSIEQATITITENYTISLTNSLGFNNSGNSSITPPSFDTGKVINLLGLGEIYSTYSGVDILTRYIINSDGLNNDDNLHYNIHCKLRAEYQGVYNLKNKARVDFFNTLQSGSIQGSVDLNLKAFNMKGGQVRLYKDAVINISSVVSGRTYGVTFEPEDDGIGYCIFYSKGATITGNAENIFAKLNDEDVTLTIYDSQTGGELSSTTPGTPTVVDGLFENLGVTRWNITMNNCNFLYTGIDFTKVDLTAGNTQSAINMIKGSVVETLRTFDNRVNALSAGVPLYTAYLKTSGVAYPTTTGWVRDIVLPA